MQKKVQLKVLVHTDMMPRFRESPAFKLMRESAAFRRSCGLGSASELSEQVKSASLLHLWGQAEDDAEEMQIELRKPEGKHFPGGWRGSVQVAASAQAVAKVLMRVAKFEKKERKKRSKLFFSFWIDMMDGLARLLARRVRCSIWEVFCKRESCS
jgi:hypothetical protein